MTVQDIEIALKKIRDIHGDIDKEKLQTLLVSALWSESDVRDGIAIWGNILATKVDQKNEEINKKEFASTENKVEKKEDLPHNLPVLHNTGSYVTTLGDMAHSVKEDISALLFSMSKKTKDNTEGATSLADVGLESKEVEEDVLLIHKEGAILKEDTSNHIKKENDMENVEHTKEEELQRLLDEAKKQLEERPPVVSLGVAPYQSPVPTPTPPVIMYVNGESGEKNGLQILVSVSILLLLVLVIIIAYMYNEGRLSP